jgi:hypothetical protein
MVWLWGQPARSPRRTRYESAAHVVMQVADPGTEIAPEAPAVPGFVLYVLFPDAQPQYLTKVGRSLLRVLPTAEPRHCS